MAHPTVHVTALVLLGGRRVRLHFDDGAVVDRDLTPLLWGPVFNKARTDPAVFATVGVDPELGTIAWPNGADFDPAVLRYEDLWEEVAALTQ